MEYMFIVIVLILIIYILKLKKKQDINDKKIVILQDFMFGVIKTLKNNNLKENIKEEVLNDNIITALTNGSFYNDIMFDKLYEKKEEELKEWIKKNTFYDKYPKTCYGDFSLLYSAILEEMLSDE